MKHIAILGSTGSIGQSTLDVIRNFPDKFRVAGLSTNSNIELLDRQIKEFHPLFVCVTDIAASKRLKARLRSNIKFFVGEDGLEALVQEKRVDKVVLAISGSCALLPLLKAIESNKDIALANKEALVMAGPIIMREADRQRIKIIPIDSEQSAIWQCLDGEDKTKLKNIHLTASGGPFRRSEKKSLKHVSISRVLRHPRWKMGKKISVDSATLMNKGLEVLEAMFLFNVPSEKIKIVIHPQAIIHSMVEFIDGVILAQLSVTDMRIPIQYALSYPERLPNSLAGIDFHKLGRLSFTEPDFKRFPCLGLAYQAARELGTMPCVLNAANEVSVAEFLKGRLSFFSIPRVIEKVLNRNNNIKGPSLSDVLGADAWAKKEAYRVIAKLN